MRLGLKEKNSIKKAIHERCGRIVNFEEKQLLQRELHVLEKASEMLRHSYTACKSIEYKSNYSLSELDLFEALTSRFARLNDLIIRKIFRLIDWTWNLQELYGIALIELKRRV